MSYDLPPINLKPGMILEKDIMDRGKLLLAKGTVIKPSYITQLISRGVAKVTVLAEKTLNEEILSNPVEKFYARSYQAVGNIIDNLKQNLPITIPQIFPVVEKILETVFANQDSMLLLTGFKEGYDYHYAHSLDVCIYSIIAAKAMDLNYATIVDLGMGALLHDVGKTKTPESILFKQGRLTAAEYEEVKKHSKYGYDIVVKIPGIKPNITQIVLQHHERCDGSGYPRGLKDGEIYRLAKIVAIADIYDALTSDRVYCKKVLPHEAAEFLLYASSTLIDPEIARVFMKHIAIYPPGCQVRLNTNEIAIVLDSNLNMPLRPLLKIIADKEGRPLKESKKCELQSHPQIFIKNIFN